MTTLWFDCETYSECDLKKYGTHRYAEHQSTEITVAQWATDDGEPVVADCTGARYTIPDALTDLLEDPGVIVVAHNSHFDRTMLRHCWGVDVPIERWRDTMVQALSHSLPGGLDKLSQVLQLGEDEAKDKRGRQLIQLFCKPRPKGNKIARATRETHPVEWAEFLEYSRQDIVAMRHVARKLPSWNYGEGKPELALWHLDQKINDRGFAVDVDFATAAITATEAEKHRLKHEMIGLTDGMVDGPSKRDQLLTYILAEYGVNLPDMAADTLRRRLDDPELPEAVKLLIAIRLEATKTSTAKYKALAAAVSPDGRLRNTLQFAGALRTARWAGRVFQPQNLKRPDAGFDGATQELGIAAVKAGVADLVFSDVMQLTANAVRGCIVAPKGKKLVTADLSNIEGRGLAFLADESWKLQAFRDYDEGTGEDLYKLAYARSFNVPADKVDKGKRQIGKVQELALGYEGGVAAFLTFSAVYNMDLDELAAAVEATASSDALHDASRMYDWVVKSGRSTLGLPRNVYVACQVLVTSWRDAHLNTRALWKSMGEAVRNAIAHRATTFYAGKHIAVRVDGAWLRVRLPSGRYLCYLNPRVEGNQITYTGVNQYTRQWGRIKTYGGKLVENATQAMARDVLAHSMPAVEDDGYAIVLTVHDELVCETPDEDSYSSDRLAELMSTVPPWAQGLPLAAAGFEAYRYRKD